MQPLVKAWAQNSPFDPSHISVSLEISNRSRRPILVNVDIQEPRELVHLPGGRNAPRRDLLRSFRLEARETVAGHMAAAAPGRRGAPFVLLVQWRDVWSIRRRRMLVEGRLPS